MNVSWRLASLVACLGCAPAPAPAPLRPAPTNAAASAAPAASASVSVSQAAPRSLELDDEPELDAERKKLRALVARAPYVLRGKVRQAAQKTEWRAGEELGYTFAIVDVLEWLKGDPKLVFARYRQSFPLFTTSIPVRVNKMPSSDHRDTTTEMLGEVGKERLFFVSLPSENNSGYTNVPPPAQILARFGKYSVSLAEHLPVEQKPAVLRAFEDLQAQRAWIEANVARLSVSERFEAVGQAATPLAVAESVRDFVLGQLAAAGSAVSVEAPKTSEHAELVTFTFALSGPAAGELSVSVSASPARGKLRAFRLRGPLLLELSKRHASLGDQELLARIERELGLRFAGGKVFRSVSRTYRGDGASLFHVSFHAGSEGDGRAERSPRSLDVVLSGDPAVIVEYTNEWARAVTAP
jgi:hypothetical protein